MKKILLPAVLAACGLMLGGAAAAKAPPDLVESKFHPEKTEFARVEGQEIRSGKHYSLAALKGKVVMITLWSIDCRFCYEELPDLQAFRDKHRRKGLEMLGLSVDDGADEIRDYLRRYPALNFPVVWRLAPGSDDGLARSKGTPTTYVVDRQGNIVFKRFGQLRDEHYAYIESLLGAKR